MSNIKGKKTIMQRFKSNIHHLKLEKKLSKKGFGMYYNYGIANFVRDFIHRFGQYISEEELIERIMRNVDKIEEKSVLNPPKANGTYRPNEKIISLKKKLVGKSLTSVFYHEIIHAISSREDKSLGFNHEYDIFEKNLDFKVICGVGIDEGTVEFMNYLIQQEIFKEPNPIAYPILTGIVENLIEIIGEDKYFNTYLNEPHKLTEMLNESLDFSQYRDSTSLLGSNPAMEFIADIDTIHRYEDKLYLRQAEKNGLDDPVWDYNYAEEEYNKNIAKAQDNILQVFLDTMLQDKINSQEQFAEIYIKIKNLHNLLSRSMSVETINKLLEQLENVSIDDMQIDDDLDKNLFLTQQIIREFDNMPNEELVSKLADKGGEELKKFLRELPFYYKEVFSQKILSKIFGDSINYTDDIGAFNILYNCIPNIFNKMSVYNDILNDISIDFTQYNLGAIITLKGKDKKVMDVFYNDTFNGTNTELEQIDYIKQQDLMKKHPEITGNDVVLGHKNANDYLIYRQDGHTDFLSSNFDEIIKPKSSVSLKSKNQRELEENTKSLEHAKTRLARLLSSGAPEHIIEEERRIISKLEDKIKGTNGENDFISPDEISKLVIDRGIRYKDIEDLMDELIEEQYEDVIRE